MHRTGQPGLLELRVEPIGLVERARIDGDDRVERGSALVIRVDPIEVLLRQRAGGQGAPRERGVDVGDRRFNDLERRGGWFGALRLADGAAHDEGDRG